MEQTLMEWLLEYGYIGIFLFLVFGIVGLPLPDEIMMTFVGYLSSVGRLNLYLAFASALTGSLCGITVSYFLGWRLGYPFLKKYGPKFFITRRRLRITQFLFRKYGNWVLFFGYFIPGVRHVTAYLAGISNLPWPRFGLYAYTGGLFWCFTFIGLGYQVGANWENALHLLHRYGMDLLWIVVPLVLVWMGWAVWQSRVNSDTK